MNWGGRIIERKKTISILAGRSRKSTRQPRFLDELPGTSGTAFIVNCLTAAATTFILMPRFVRWFGWWLFVDPKKPAWLEPAGLFVVVGLYAIEIASVWHLLHW
jgi:hypothetical protein